MSRFATPTKHRQKNAKVFNVASYPIKPHQKEVLHRYGSGTALTGPSVKGGHQFDGIVIDGTLVTQKLNYSSEKLNKTRNPSPTVTRPSVTPREDRTKHSKSPVPLGNTVINTSFRSTTPNKYLSSQNLNTFNRINSSSNVSVGSLSVYNSARPYDNTTTRPRSTSSISSRSRSGSISTVGGGITPISRLSMNRTTSFVVDPTASYKNFLSPNQQQQAIPQSTFSPVQSTSNPFDLPHHTPNNNTNKQRSISPNSLSRSLSFRAPSPGSINSSAVTSHHTNSSTGGSHTIHNIQLTQGSFRTVRKELRRENIDEFLSTTAAQHENVTDVLKGLYSPVGDGGKGSNHNGQSQSPSFHSYQNKETSTDTTIKRIKNLINLSHILKQNVESELADICAVATPDELYFSTENAKSDVICSVKEHLLAICGEYSHILHDNLSAVQTVEKQAYNVKAKLQKLIKNDHIMQLKVETKLKQNTKLKQEVSNLLQKVEFSQEQGLNFRDLLYSIYGDTITEHVAEQLKKPELLQQYEEAEPMPSETPPIVRNSHKGTGISGGINSAYRSHYREFDSDDDSSDDVSAAAVEGGPESLDQHLTSGQQGHTVHDTNGGGNGNTGNDQRGENSAFSEEENSRFAVNYNIIEQLSGTSLHNLKSPPTLEAQQEQVRAIYEKINELNKGKEKSKTGPAYTPDTHDKSDDIDLHTLAYSKTSPGRIRQSPPTNNDKDKDKVSLLQKFQRRKSSSPLSRQRMAAEIQQALSQSTPPQQQEKQPHQLSDTDASKHNLAVIPPHLHNTPAGMGSPKLTTTVPKHNYGTRPVLNHSLSPQRIRPTTLTLIPTATTTAAKATTDLTPVPKTEHTPVRSVSPYSSLERSNSGSSKVFNSGGASLTSTGNTTSNRSETSYLSHTIASSQPKSVSNSNTSNSSATREDMLRSVSPSFNRRVEVAVNSSGRKSPTRDTPPPPPPAVVAKVDFRKLAEIESFKAQYSQNRRAPPRVPLPNSPLNSPPGVITANSTKGIYNPIPTSNINNSTAASTSNPTLGVTASHNSSAKRLVYAPPSPAGQQPAGSGDVAW